MLQGKKILLGVTGSIAAYKIPILVRLLIKQGAEVKVIVTPSAKNFVSSLTLSTLSKQPALSDLETNDSWANHVMLGRWADIMLIAPLSCNSLAKMAAGLCDNLLMAVYLSATCPVVVAPAMDEDMWLHPSTRSNINKIRDFGNQVIPVDNGELASGLSGEGRMAEPEAIVAWLDDFFFNANQLKGKKVLVTAGPTYEAIDPVRFIGNHSSGKMGVAIANEFKKRGAEVTLILGPSQIMVPDNIRIIHVQSADEMFSAAVNVFESADIAVMSAAVADYTPVNISNEKIKKQTDSFSIELKKTKDILKYLGECKKAGQFLVGFALETTNEKEYALKKLKDKNADMIVLNSLRDNGAGFGHDTNKITIFDKQENEHLFETKSKTEVAADIVNTIIQLYA
ncbi:bifunctional phosphopantothenoylcysteine decarboxylase/phosphopantothenate--cysteine ligase CoaBC [Ferruginibacter lapsinanis]|uniref:bifunctional phosphopantothenoylcysteine decarboxylase/phosphopantothenate--cysteine ligase CoaBC n=1 Tax=Ferruginibacter lapsinanis TaxID=563172 RepID=UPI001E5F56D9|nr:bifunctional phosphopantothenoylcysteine decarboxylase/phosphopantothenate--cysteine ligase CoaBC [Ferruginibacter lapsinanis]UEG48586.1 bifunctional phosphopantothenoylcysteine decarboxylase/phosphopantothenate--cysteine ligase CoaBC [Ferruginibacter lapsinanis]